MKNALLLIVGICFSIGSLCAQNISNVSCHQEDNMLVVGYSIDGFAENVNLFVSTDGGKNYQGPLKSVSGDVHNVSPGQKRIIWNVLSEFDSLSGDNIVFEVRTASYDTKQKYTAGTKTFSTDQKYTSGINKSQSVQNDLSRYQKSYKRGKSMKVWGITLTSIGVAWTSIMIVSSCVNKNTDELKYSYFGLPFFCVGIPLWCVGSQIVTDSQAVYSYAPVVQIPIEMGNIALVPSIGLTNDNLTSQKSFSAGLAFRF